MSGGLPTRASVVSLIGFMGTGKTAVGRKLAEKLGWQFVDTDELIEQRVGKSVAAIFKDSGERRFREMEAQVVASMPSWQHTVVATGGGTVLQPDNAETLRRCGPVICLTARSEVILARVGAARSDRPLLAVGDPQRRIAELLAERAPAYSRAELAVDTSDRDPGLVAAEIYDYLCWRSPAIGGTA